MTDLSLRIRRTPTAPRRPRRVAAALGTALVVGLVVGAAGFVAESLVDSPVWVSIFHRLGPWGLATVAVGAAHGDRLTLAAAAGLVTEVGLVLGYYCSESLLTGRGLDIRPAVAYGVLALLCGPALGLAGASLRDPRGPWRRVSLGLAAAPFLADGSRVFTAALTIGRHVGPSTAVALAYLVLGVGVCLGLARTRRDAAGGLGAGVLVGILIVVGLDVVLA